MTELDAGAAAPAESEWTTEELNLQLAGAPTLAQREDTCPFPGPRSFSDSEKDFFVGRSEEARDLLSLLISNPITLLYSPSGAGKTSLINAKLLPLMEQREYQKLPVARVGGYQAATAAGEGRSSAPPSDARNPYVFNTLQYWSKTPSPSRTLHEYLKSLGAARDSDGDPTLRMAIFDQFEELFTTHRANFEGRTEFFGQLAEALSQHADLRILIVLREEYLAGLDRYASSVPGRLQARMRLERLTEKGAKAALKAPLLERGVLISDLAATYITSRLRTVLEDSGKEALGEFVEPVQLQVVCRRLWFSLRAGTTHISRADVGADLGDVRAALITFYEDALASTVAVTRTPEHRIRSWIERELITESGTRGNVFRGEETAGGMANAVVDELDKQLVVRGEPRAGGRWYELAHDALIAPIRESNRRAAKQRSAFILRLVALVSVPLLVALVVLVTLHFQPPVEKVAPSPDLAARFWQYPAEREAILAQLSQLPPPKLDSVLPPTPIDLDSVRGPFAVRLRYRQGTFDPARLQNEWLRRAAVLERKGYAAPSNLLLEADAAIDKASVSLELIDAGASSGAVNTRVPADGAASPAVPVPTAGDGGRNQPRERAAVSTGGRSGGSAKPAELRASANRLPAFHIENLLLLEEPVLLGALPTELASPALGIQPLDPGTESQGRLWYKIPAWSWPLFRARPGLLRPPEAVVVDQVFARVSSRASRLFIAEPWLPRLLKHALARKSQAGTQAEFGEALYTFHCPATLLGALNETAAGFAVLPDAEALFDETFQRTDAYWLARLPAKQRPALADAAECPTNALYPSWQSLNEAVRNDDVVVRQRGPLHVVVGTGVARSVTAGHRLRDELLEGFDEALQSVFEATGVVLPDPMVTVDRQLEPNVFRFDTTDEIPWDWENAPLAVGTSVIKDVVSAVAHRLRRDPAAWVDLAAARRFQDRLPPVERGALSSWRAADFVRILRSVLSPPRSAPANCPVDVADAAGRTLAESRWLFSSLPVWRGLSSEPDCVARALRALSARRELPRSAAASPVSPNAIVALIQEEKADAARKAFSEQYAARGKAVVDEFISAYSAAYDKEREVSPLLAKCSAEPRPASGAAVDGADRHRLLSFAKDRQLRPELQRKLRLCALAFLGAAEFNGRAGKLAEELSAALEKEPAAWPPLERAALQYWRFDSALPRATIPEVFELPEPPSFNLELWSTRSAELAKSVAVLDEPTAFSFVNAAWSSCPTGGRVTRFCSNLRNEFAAALPSSFFVLLNAGLQLATAAYDEASARGALELLEKAEGQLPAGELGFKAWLAYGRARAESWRLSLLDAAARRKFEDEQWRLADQLSRKPLLNAVDVPAVAGLAVSAAAYSLEPKHIEAAILRARRLAPTSNVWELEDFKLAMWRGDSKRAGEILQRGIGARSLEPTDPWTLPLAVAAALMPEQLNVRQFQSAGNSALYRVHTRLLAACGPRGNSFHSTPQDELKGTWAEIDPRTWAERLEQNDSSVWGEVLLGDFMGAEPARVLVEGLEREGKTSPLTKAGMNPWQMRCELYFYRALRRRATTGTIDAETKQLLNRVIETGEAGYYEFAAAKFLLH